MVQSREVLAWAKRFGSALSALYPARCLICGSRGTRHAALHPVDLCESCSRSLPANKVACAGCALPLSDDIEGERYCGRCQRKPMSFDRCYSAYRYEAELIGLITRLKFHGSLAAGRLLGELLCDHLDSSDVEHPELILPVPLHGRRLRQRGFNQSLEVARIIGGRWSVPVRWDVLRRVRDTGSQTGLDAGARKRNIRGAFEVGEALPASHVAIVDDVVTTMATVEEMSRLLRRNGVDRIDIYSVARALPSSYPMGRSCSASQRPIR